MRTFGPLVLTLFLGLTGCTLSPTSTPTPESGLSIRGAVHGGQQPISGAQIYLFAANTTGYGGSGIAPSSANASISLLTSVPGSTAVDKSGGPTNGDYFVTSDMTGSFSISSDYTCTVGQQVYLYALGGNPGAGTNSSSGLMAILGSCPASGNFVTATPFVEVNELSTIAAAYAFSGFASDATHVSFSGTALAQTGIANAFANAANLVSLSSGAALATTPAGNGTVPQATISTLGNILAACVNSSGAITGPTNASPCYTLFNNAPSLTATPVIPSDTATAAINIAHNPGANVANLYNLPKPAAPFAPALSAQPNDFTVGISFSGGGLYYPSSLAIDGSGNAWIANYGYEICPPGETCIAAYGTSVSQFSSMGVALSPSTGYTGGGLYAPSGIAIDSSGDVWTTDSVNSSALSKLSNAGIALSPSSGYTGGGMDGPDGIAFDGVGNAWVADYYPGGSPGMDISEFSSAGGALSPNGFTGGGLYAPVAIAVDGSGNAWIADSGQYGSIPSATGGLSKFSNAGVGLSPPQNGIHGGYTGGGLFTPNAVAVDGAGNVWVVNPTNTYAPSPNGSLSEFSNAGVPLSPATGFSGGGLNGPGPIAIDGAGSVWIVDSGNSISNFSNAGVALSPAKGYTNAGLNGPVSIAIDGSGNAWLANYARTATVTELIGIAAPVVTPISAGLPATPTANGSSYLGTRP